MLEKEKENIVLKNSLIKNYIDKKIGYWKRPAYFCIPLIFLILVFFYLQIFNCNWEYNYAQQLINYIDTNPSETKRDWMRIIINGGLISSLVTLVIFSFNRLICNDKLEEKTDRIKQKIPCEFK